jgi:L-asparaginase II
LPQPCWCCNGLDGLDILNEYSHFQRSFESFQMANPVLVEVIRGGIAESRHRGAYAIIGEGGKRLGSAGDITTPIFPRSAMKALQALPLVESGAADAFGLSPAEVALACSSHNGEEQHVNGALSVLAKAGGKENEFACGSQWPRDDNKLLLSGQQPRDVHNNCSGKHAGMLAYAHHMGFEPKDYWKIDHDVQQAVAKTISEICDYDLSSATWGFDGCSLPNWAIPLQNLALGFSRMATGETLSLQRKAAADKIIAAVRAHPFMVAGTGRFCTRLMEAVPRAFVKVGAEGVYCATIAHAGIGIALKCDDGERRASEPAMAAILANLDVWTPAEKKSLEELSVTTITNRRKITTGEIRAVI